LSWLESHTLEVDSRFVLSVLLERDDLNGEVAARAIQYTLSWLESHTLEVDGQFVLSALLRRDDLNGEAAARAIQYTLSWLNQYGRRADASHVIPPLLERRDLDSQTSLRATRDALLWVAENSGDDELDFVLRALLERSEDVSLPQQVITSIETWLQRHANDASILFVTKYLLRRRILSTAICGYIIDWARDNISDPDAAWRLSNLSRWIRHYPAVWGNFFDCVSVLLDSIEGQTEANRHGEIDNLMANLVKSFRTGWWAALVDDSLQRWIFSPVSLADRVSPISQERETVSRIISLFYSGRLDEDMAPRVLSLLRRWVTHWGIGEERSAGLQIIQAFSSQANAYRQRYDQL
jgi:hypothetical protein